MPYMEDDEIDGLRPLTDEDRKNRNLENFSGLDQKLVLWAGVLSPTEIGERLGIPPEDVAKRTLGVLNSVDYLDIDQLIAKQVLQLNFMISEGIQRLSTASDKAAPAYINSVGGNVQRAISTLREMQLRAETNHAAMEQAYARRMVEIVSRAYDRYLGKLQERFKDVTADDLITEFHETILQISREIDSEI